ncbi:MAG: sugar phosphate isomerase/epimerase [Proteobacteria bacterium]|nr:sugar phosphate isomerase/epimerase [Pseudomonadota bacterium]
MGHLTLGWLTLFDVPPADVVTAAAEGGFDSVGLRITGRRLSDSDYPVAGHPSEIREIRRRLTDEGVRLSNTSIYHLYPEITLDHLQPAIEATAELGAEIIVVTCMDPDEARWTAFIAACCERTEEFGLKLALEFVPYSHARNLAQGCRIVRNAQQPNFGLLVDSLHLARSGGAPRDLANIDPGLIVFAQLCDAAREIPPGMDLATEARTGRLYPGDGGLPLHAFLDALPADIEIEVEMPRGDQVALSPNERALRAGEATRRFLADYHLNRVAKQSP